MRIRSSSPPTLSLAPLPPTPAPSATTPVSPVDNPQRQPTPFDELPMSHLISFPHVDSPTSADPVDIGNPFDSFHTIPQHPYTSYQSPSTLIRDAFDYYRLQNNNPSPISDALSMSMQGTALKPQLHANTMPDLTSVLYSAPTHQPQHQDQQQQQQQCIPTSHLFSTPALTPAHRPKDSSPTLDDDGTALPFPKPRSASNIIWQLLLLPLLHLLRLQVRKRDLHARPFRQKTLYLPMSAVFPSVKHALSKTAQQLSLAVNESVKSLNAWKCEHVP